MYCERSLGRIEQNSSKIILKKKKKRKKKEKPRKRRKEKKKKKKKKEKRGWKKTFLYHITSLTTDNTGSNTGVKGVRGVLERERKISWEKNKEGHFRPLFLMDAKITLPILQAQSLKSA